MFCSECGVKKDPRHQLNQTKVSTAEVIILMIVMLISPLLLIKLFSDVKPVLLMALLVSTVLIILSLLELILKRPYIPLIFGCHQKCNRSFKVFNRHVVICARCSGIYIGILLSPALLYFTDLPFYVYILLSIPLIIDGALQHFKHIKSTNLRRFVSGILFSLSFLYFYGLFNQYIVYFFDWMVVFFR